MSNDVRLDGIPKMRSGRALISGMKKDQRYANNSADVMTPVTFIHLLPGR